MQLYSLYDLRAAVISYSRVRVLIKVSHDEC